MIQLFQVGFAKLGHGAPYGVVVGHLGHSAFQAGLLVLFELYLCLTVCETVPLLHQQSHDSARWIEWRSTGAPPPPSWRSPIQNASHGRKEFSKSDSFDG
jgi:hypothetical protein